MIQFSLLEKLSMLFNIILSSSFFLIAVIVGIVFTVTLIISLRKNKKINKKLFMLAWIFVIAFIVIRYFNTFFPMLDNLIENIFISIYFPNLATYVAIILASNFILVYTVTQKKTHKYLLILDTINYIVINILFLLIADIVVSEHIDIYSRLTVYSNSNLLVLLELSTGVFGIWLFTLGLIWIVNKIIKANKEEKDISSNVIYDSKQGLNTGLAQETIYDNYVHNEFEGVEILNFDGYNDTNGNLFNKYMHDSNEFEGVEILNFDENDISK